MILYHQVPKKWKINLRLFQQHFLTPICSNNLFRLYGNGINRVSVHMYNVSSQTSRSTLRFLQHIAQLFMLVTTLRTNNKSTHVHTYTFNRKISDYNLYYYNIHVK